MRHALVALAIVGCGGHPSGPGDATPSTPHSLTVDNIARACVNAYACLAPPIDGPTLPSCLGHLDDFDTVISIYRPDQILCLAAAGADCMKARACLGYTIEPCSPDGVRCDGDRLVDCSRGSGLVLDCRGGLWFDDDATCIPASEPSRTNPTCGLATCTDSTPDRCDGTRILGCNNGVLQAVDCAELGGTCMSDGTGVTCSGIGATCTSSRCEGTTLTRCEGGHEYVYHCAEMFDGGTCFNYGREGASCDFGPSCSGTYATCAGDVTQLCVLGAQTSVDCVASGFARCELGSCIPATFP